MLQLEKDFTRNGYQYQQEHRTDNIALYKLRAIHPRTGEPEDMPANWEVVKIHIREATTITVGNKTFEVVEKEIYPRIASWGTDGFTFNLYEDAKKFYKSLVEKRSGSFKDSIPD